MDALQAVTYSLIHEGFQFHRPHQSFRRRQISLDLASVGNQFCFQLSVIGRIAHLIVADPLPLAPHHVEIGHHTPPFPYLGHDNLVHGVQAIHGCENQRTVWDRCRLKGLHHAVWIEGHGPESRIHDREYGIYTGQGLAAIRSLVFDAQGKPAGDLVGGHVAQIAQYKRLGLGRQAGKRPA